MCLLVASDFSIGCRPGQTKGAALFGRELGEVLPQHGNRQCGEGCSSELCWMPKKCSYAVTEAVKMSPISEASAKVLVDALNIALAKCHNSELRFKALEAVLEEDQPATIKPIAAILSP